MLCDILVAYCLLFDVLCVGEVLLFSSAFMRFTFFLVYADVASDFCLCRAMLDMFRLSMLFAVPRFLFCFGGFSHVLMLICLMCF